MSASPPSEGGLVALCAQRVAAAAAAAAAAGDDDDDGGEDDDDDDDERSGRSTNLSAEIRTNKHRPPLSLVNVVASVALLSLAPVL